VELLKTTLCVEYLFGEIAFSFLPLLKTSNFLLRHFPIMASIPMLHKSYVSFQIQTTLETNTCGEYNFHGFVSNFIKITLHPVGKILRGILKKQRPIPYTVLNS